MIAVICGRYLDFRLDDKWYHVRMSKPRLISFDITIMSMGKQI